MIDPLDPPTDKEVTDINVSNNTNKFDRQNFLSLIDRVIFKKWHTEITIQERLIPLKYYKKSSERLIQANGEKLLFIYAMMEYILRQSLF